MFTPRLRAFLDACFSTPLLSQPPADRDLPPSATSLTPEEIQASRRERLRRLSGPGKEPPAK